MLKFLFRLLVLSMSISFIVFEAISEDNHIILNPKCVDMESFFVSYPLARTNQSELENFTRDFIKNNQPSIAGKNKYIIPIVIHIFGTDFAGYTVDDNKIRTAINKTNEDFQGLNDDFLSVNQLFLDVRGQIDIEFRIASVDPEGNPTTGILYYPEDSGLAKSDSTANAKISSIAWDNYSYMNLYLMLDLYSDGITYNSGYAFYPNKYMSDLNLARIVYNPRYIYGNTSKEFASVLTHEFGHWLNLIHTFEGGCSMPNDLIADTPPVDNAGMGCTALNCQQDNINGENYMDYNTTCYKMFTNGQIQRMEAALDSETRKSLWQDSNLIKTGTFDEPASILKIDNTGITAYPNPVSNDKLFLNFTGNNNLPKYIYVYDATGNRITSYISENAVCEIDFSGYPSGLYLINIFHNNQLTNIKIVK